MLGFNMAITLPAKKKGETMDRKNNELPSCRIVLVEVGKLYKADMTVYEICKLTYDVMIKLIKENKNE